MADDSGLFRGFQALLREKRESWTKTMPRETTSNQGDHRDSLAALHLLPRGGESSSAFAGRRTALPRLPPPRQRALVVMAATLTLQT